MKCFLVCLKIRTEKREVADLWVRSMSVGDGVLKLSIGWFCRFIPVHSGCCSFTHGAPLRAFGALAEM